MYPYFNNNQNMLNQLIRQKENVENMINQYSQIPNQPPIQNIINQGAGVEFEARELKAGEDVKNILVQRRTLFIDEANQKVFVKELDGNISKEYDIIVPLDEKDRKIQELEDKLKNMEVMINNVRSAECTKSDDEFIEPVANDDGILEPKPKRFGKSIQKTESK